VVDTAVLVVSYRRADLLVRCLNSLDRFAGDSRILVWDNRSDGTAEIKKLAAKYPDVEWTFHPENIGFSRAVNQMSYSCPESDKLLFNPDAELIRDIRPLQQTLKSHPDMAAVAPMIFDSSRHPWDNAHRHPTMARALISRLGYSSLLRGTPLSDNYSAPPQGEPGYLSGACLLISKDAWADVGGFDERYFLYSEEVDWQTRARSRGWRTRMVPVVAARHATAGTVSDNPGGTRLSDQLLIEGQIRFLGDHRHAWQAKTYRRLVPQIDRLVTAREALRRRVHARESAGNSVRQQDPPSETFARWAGTSP